MLNAWHCSAALYSWPRLHGLWHQSNMTRIKISCSSFPLSGPHACAGTEIDRLRIATWPARPFNQGICRRVPVMGALRFDVWKITATALYEAYYTLSGRVFWFKECLSVVRTTCTPPSIDILRLTGIPFLSQDTPRNGYTMYTYIYCVIYQEIATFSVIFATYCLFR